MLLTLPTVTDYSAAAFAPTAGSSAARKALDGFAPTGQPHAGEALMLVGPSASGKSHLLTICRERMAGNPLAVAVDDLHALDRQGQELLFHTYNDLRARGGALVIASTHPVTELTLLPDLQSRLATARHVYLAPPDDAELRQLMAKWAADKQLLLPPAVLDYALSRTERSVAVLKQLIETLDELSLEHQRAITVPLVRQVFDKK